MTRTVAETTERLARLFPKGKIWPQDAVTTPVWWSLLSAMAEEFTRVENVLRGILNDLIPDSAMTAGLLEEWEELLDLTPQAADSDADRILAIRSTLGQNLSPSVPELEAFAAALKPSAVVTHQEYPRFAAGLSRSGDRCGKAWIAVWTVTYTGPEDLAFEAAMRAVSPQNTTLIFEVV